VRPTIADKKTGLFMTKKIVIILAIALGLLVAFSIAIAISNLMIASRVPVQLLDSRMVIGDKTFAEAAGTIVTVGERDAFPLQTAVIKCLASEMNCQIARAKIIPGNFLTVELNTVPVIEWTDSHLVIEEKTPCLVNTFDINWRTKTGTGLRKRLSKPEDGADCSAFIVDELRMELRDGFDVWQEEQRHAYPLFIKLLTSNF
jgi:hypothetical protein